MADSQYRQRLFVAVAALLMCGCHPVSEDKLGPYSGDARYGRRLADEFGCGACHVIPGIAGARGEAGPSLRRMGRRGYIAGRAPNTEEAMIEFLLAPETVAPGTAMPAVGLTRAQARDIAAFLRTLE